MNQNVKTALIIGGIIIAVIVILSVVPGLLWGWQGYGYGMMGPGMMGGYGAMFIMPILWIVVIGLFGMVGGMYTPVGFNAWRETDGKLSIGECAEQDTFRIEGTDLVMRDIDAPSGFWDCNDAQEQANTINKNMRAVLQLFNIRVHIFPDRIEVQGAIPTQVLDISSQKEPPGTPIIVSAGGRQGVR